MFELIEKMKNCKGKEVLDNEIKHLYWLGRFLEANFKDFNKEINNIVLIYAHNLRPNDSIKEICHYGYIRKLYNVLESFYVLKQHTEEVIVKYQTKKTFNKECISKRQEFNIKSAESIFLLRFRAYVVHHGLPITTIKRKFQQGQDIEVKIYLSKKHLLKWEDWDTAAEQILPYINSMDENIDINKLLVECINNLNHFVNWIITKITEINKASIQEYDDLITQWNNLDIVMENSKINP